MGQDHILWNVFANYWAVTCNGLCVEKRCDFLFTSYVLVARETLQVPPPHFCTLLYFLSSCFN